MVDLSDLIAEGRQKAQQEQATPRAKPKRKPDALILYAQTKVCQNCGRRYEHPNDCILWQLGSTITRISEWHEEYNYTPRQVHHYETPVAACQECFEEADLGKEVVTKKEG